VRNLSTERLYLVDPYNDKHREMIKEFEDNNSFTHISSNLEKIINSVSKEEYQKEKIQKNEIEEILFLEKDSKIIEMCYVHGEKDIKIAKIMIIPTKEKEKLKKMISLTTDFTFQNWHIEEIFIEVDGNDKTIMNYLESEEYENLGEERGKTIYLKERKDLEIKRRARI